MVIKIEERVDGIDRRIEALLRSQEELKPKIHFSIKDIDRFQKHLC